jgi:SAM-dependent methyltransferase
MINTSVKQNNKKILYDDPDRDFRKRYRIPEHFTWDPYEIPAIMYDGYLKIIFDLLPIPPCSVLDVGCGDGWVADRLIAMGYRVTGLDYSDNAVAFARILTPGAAFNLIDIRNLSETIEYHSDFDVACCIDVLEHIPPEYHRKVLFGMRCCLKEQGNIIVSVPSIFKPLNPMHYKHFSADELVRLITDSGFKVEDFKNQFKLCWANSKTLWRLVKNKYYDVVYFRRWLRKYILRHCNTAPEKEGAGRYIVKAVKT